MKEQIQCKHVRRKRESCRLNNSCRYPDCPSPNRGNPYHGLKKEDFKIADMAIKKFKI
jgi:hypothetical protein